MNKTEELLQELVDMQRKEFKRMKTARILHFIFVTLPTLALILISIVGSVILFQKTEELLKNFPQSAQEYQKSFFENLKSNFTGQN
ncbi:MAG: hypothetical protein AAB836_00470 [Patescibacteria group bacterium]